MSTSAGSTLSRFFQRKLKPIRRLAQGFRPGVESLEDRVTPSAVTFVNDNWVLVDDADDSNSLTVGDIVDNRLDEIGPLLQAVYGDTGFGTVVASADPGAPIAAPTALATADEINDAIANTDPNGTVNVLVGVYTEAVNINKTLSVLGAQAGVSPFTRDGLFGETVLDNPTGSVSIEADNVVFAGFTVTGQDTSGGFGAAITTSPSVSGAQIRENIIRDNALGLFLTSTATNPVETVVESNLFQDNNATFDSGTPIANAGTGIRGEDLVNAAIRGNIFRGDHPSGAVVLVDTSATTTAGDVSNVTITANTFQQGTGVAMIGVEDSIVSANIFTGLSVRTGSALNLPAVNLAGGNVDVTVAGNTFLNRGADAINLNLSSGVPAGTGANSDIVIAENLIRQDVGLFVSNSDTAMISVTSALGLNQISENEIHLTGSIHVEATFNIHGIMVGSTGAAANAIGTIVVAQNLIVVEGNAGPNSANLRIGTDVPETAKLYIVNNTFLGGAIGVDVARASGAPLPDIDINYNNILSHTVGGIRLTTDVAANELDAQYNFFGSASGPNTTGSDAVVVTSAGTINVTPFLTTPLLPFAAHFNGTNGAGLGGAWQTAVGGYTIQGNAAVGSAGLNVALVAGAEAVDVSVQADVTLPAPGNWAGLVARYSGAGDANMYFGAVANVDDQLVAFIWVNVDGTWTLLNSQAVAGVDATAAHTVRFDVFGSSLRLFVDGELAVSAVDSQLTQPGQAGIRSGTQAQLDNLRVTLSPLNEFLNFSDTFRTGTTLDADTWSTQLGSFAVQNQTLVGQAGGNIAIVEDTVAANVAVEADVTLASDGEWAGLVARHNGTGDANLYFAALANVSGQLQAFIHVSENGSYTLLTSATLADLTAADTHSLRFEAVGTSLKLFVDDTLRLLAHDDTHAAGSVGLRIGAGAEIDNFSADSIVQRIPALPFTAEFDANVATSNQLDRFWTERVGNFNLTTNAALGTQGLNVATVNGTLVSDVMVQANVNVASNNQWAGLIARYSGPADNNMYFAALANVDGTLTAFIWVNVNGTWNMLASATLGAASTHNLRFEVVGTELKVFVDNNIVLSISDSSLSHGLVGIRSGADASIDNLVVAQLHPVV